ncbi:AAA family ATPase [Dactylosporangium roseum]|uniref:AAA family ATPase n=1 Tax=Dactylosporangium roseum TaxID=47989 RepID=A0ABY5YXW9_9ACTN|nr:AAA domain-containing protein [Dactylosporangium roseum]UWZ33703.1 AAA family ATPase [Dactylosporangium roseum]
MEPSRVLAALADLAPAGRERTLDVAKGDQPLVWLDDPDRAPKQRAVDRLAALDLLHRDERILRRGWAWLLGVAEVDGTVRKLRLPLVAEPIRLERVGRAYRIVPAGDLELTPLVTDRDLAAVLEAAPGLGTAAWLDTTGTVAWVATAAEAAGLKPDRIAKGATPIAGLPTSELLGQAIAGLFVARDVSSAGLRDTLRAWAARTGLEQTALAAVYGTGQHHERSAETDDPVSPLPLNPAQREVVRRTRHEQVVVVSGPPGNGKSHAVVAAALDTVYRGGSVLVATQSAHAAEVLGELLGRYPGPEPVLFGNAERRDRFAVTLTAGLPGGTTTRQLHADEAAVAAARTAVAAVTAGLGAALDLERTAASLRTWEPLLAGLRAEAPRVFAAGFDVELARRLLRRGLLRRWRLRRMTGADEARLPALLDAVEADRAAATLAVNGGTDLGPAWAALARADADLATAIGTAMRHAAVSARRWDGGARRSTAALAAALRAGRNRRREALAALDGPALVGALPLWIGTVTDVEDLLPPTPGLFDLVILDEAAHIDQIRAAPVLARARRALVVGDPNQLRFVSFVADVDVAATLARHDLTDRVDVRRSSAFDVAVGAAPVTWLGAHYRCAPHLIDFSARRFYAGRLALMTRHPHTERIDAIDVVHVPGAAVADGVNRAEVDAVLRTVRELSAAGVTGVGVVTPFRAQADAIESALLQELPVEEIERLGLRSGTVHAFQGSEAATVVVSLGLVDGDSPARQRFVADPNLFNVMVTRARDRLVVVTSLTGGAGLVADYLAHAEGPRASPADPDPAAVPFVRRLAAELTTAGHDVRVGYPVGDWRVDLVADGVGLICGPHPDGNAAHIERQRALLRAGWTLRDAFASRWAGDPVRAALDLSGDLAGALPGISG